MVQEMQDSRWKAQGRDALHLAKIPKYFEGFYCQPEQSYLRMTLFPEFSGFAFKIMEEEQWNPAWVSPTRDTSLNHAQKTHPVKKDPRTAPFGPFSTPRISLIALIIKALSLPNSHSSEPRSGRTGAESVPLSSWLGAGSIPPGSAHGAVALGDPLANIWYYSLDWVWALFAGKINEKRVFNETIIYGFRPTGKLVRLNSSQQRLIFWGEKVWISFQKHGLSFQNRVLSWVFLFYESLPELMKVGINGPLFPFPYQCV